MHVCRSIIALPLLALLLAGNAAQEQNKSAGAAPVQGARPAEPTAVPAPMASYARFVGGEWQVTFASGQSAAHAWHWGPGNYSMRKMANMSNAAGNPWAGEILYWHPGRKQVRTLSMHEDIPAVGRGVAEGTIEFNGDTTTSFVDLYQPRGRRKLGQKQVFAGPDKYHEALLEDSGAGLQPLAEWDFIRIRERPAAQPSNAEQKPPSDTAAPKLPPHLKCFEALIGPTWEGKFATPTVGELRTQSTFEWIPSLEVICARTYAPNKDGTSTFLLDAYFYQHVGTKALRCLALTSQGGVYEGDVTALEGGGVQLDVKGYEGDRVVPQVVRLEVEKDGTLHQRVWTVNGAERTLTHDITHTAPKSKTAAAPDQYFTPVAAKITPYMPSVIIRGIREDRAGNVWFATFAGPIRYDGKQFENFQKEVGLPKRRIFSLAEDRTGAMWFGSITGGAARYDGKSFTNFTATDGLGDNDVTWVFEDRDANIWFGTGKGASRYDGKTLTNFTTKDGLVHDAVYAIAQDASGKIWFGTQGGICSYDGKRFTNLADQVGMTFKNVRSMAVDKSGNMWFGGEQGAFHYDGMTLKSFTSANGLLSDFVGSMIVDRSGNTWFGHPGGFPDGKGGGATRYDGKTFTHFTKANGLGSATVYCMHEDRAGNIWFGSVDAGACSYDGKTFTYYSESGRPDLNRRLPAPKAGFGKAAFAQ